jgi:hypothetical protein
MFARLPVKLPTPWHDPNLWDPEYFTGEENLFSLLRVSVQNIGYDEYSAVSRVLGATKFT